VTDQQEREVRLKNQSGISQLHPNDQADAADAGGRPRRAIILIAGGGGRLRPLTEDVPKGLLDVGGRPIVEHQMTCLRAAGIREIALVTGHGSEKVCERLGDRVVYFHNDKYRETNSLYSAWLARDFGRPGCLILNSDVLFHPLLLQRLLAAPSPDAILVDLRSDLGEEEMKIVLGEAGRVLSVSKNLDPAIAHGENVGIVRLGREGAGRFFEVADREIGRREWNHWVPYAVNDLCSTQPFLAVPTEGYPWIEIDYLHDLKAAREKVFPEISGALESLDLGTTG
jgi:choline kinase